MKRLINILLLAVMLCTPYFATAQNYTRNGNEFSVTSKSKAEPIKTKYTWKDSKGVVYPVYMSANGSCFVIKISKKTGKEYRNYLGPEVSAQICKELGIEYKAKKNGRT